jgi:hypothetical protein
MLPFLRDFFYAELMLDGFFTVASANHVRQIPLARRTNGKGDNA